MKLKKSYLILLVLSVFLFISISGCIQRETVKYSEQAVQESNAKIQEPVQIEDNSNPYLSSQSLGKFCSGEECISFCNNYRGECRNYCNNDPENELCKSLFKFEESPDVDEINENKDKRKIINEDTPLILKNLVVNMEPWDRETNLAGDFIFTKKILFNDGVINNDKVFFGFGEFENNINNPDRSVEYWWFLSPGTKVHAAADGVVSISFIEHSKDWGVNIAQGWTSYKAPTGSKWIVGQEHLVNLVVKDGDIVKAGDILGEAAPRTFNDQEFGFTELSVWTGGTTIIKYCPFEFLDEPLKPIYEEKINQLTKNWEEFIEKDIYKQEDWIAPGCLLHNITER
ncbi:M23 family metallopeptidase [Candidatus Woesearchaeota archaeon]|nr:M23 family metallopeptidase [Candidatus Woesearchaeota archaeon]